MRTGVKVEEMRYIEPELSEKKCDRHAEKREPPPPRPRLSPTSPSKGRWKEIASFSSGNHETAQTEEEESLFSKSTEFLSVLSPPSSPKRGEAHQDTFKDKLIARKQRQEAATAISRPRPNLPLATPPGDHVAARRERLKRHLRHLPVLSSKERLLNPKEYGQISDMASPETPDNLLPHGGSSSLGSGFEGNERHHEIIRQYTPKSPKSMSFKALEQSSGNVDTRSTYPDRVATTLNPTHASLLSRHKGVFVRVPSSPAASSTASGGSQSFLTMLSTNRQVSKDVRSYLMRHHRSEMLRMDSYYDDDQNSVVAVAGHLSPASLWEERSISNSTYARSKRRERVMGTDRSWEDIIVDESPTASICGGWFRLSCV